MHWWRHPGGIPQLFLTPLAVSAAACPALTQRAVPEQTLGTGHHDCCRGKLQRLMVMGSPEQLQPGVTSPDLLRSISPDEP